LTFAPGSRGAVEYTALAEEIIRREAVSSEQVAGKEALTEAISQDQGNTFD
jgi:hypothetical protein